MKRKMNCTIGNDIGKDTLVIHRLPDKATLEVSNDKAGLTKFLRWLSREEAFLVSA
jgi:transposase